MMLGDMDTNEGDVSDAMSDNDYEDVTQLHEHLEQEFDHDHDHDQSHDDTDTDKMNDPRQIKTEANGDSQGAAAAAAAEPKKKYDPKDPLRPRRKKARRACFACQRAHLTCGDERPCQRCIKRGLAEGCQDGVRKKAKYLHDAPAEALRPVLGPNYNAPASSTSGRTTANGHRHPSNAGSDVSASNVASFFSQSTAPSFPVFTNSQTPTGTLPENLAFPGSQSPASPGFPSNANDNNPLSGISGLSSASAGMTSFSPALFDPSNPALFNFNLEGINFGSQYAAMEFGMLGHMSGAGTDDPNDPTSISQQGGRNGSGVGSFSSAAADVFGNGGVSQTLYDGSAAGAGGLMNDFMNLDSATNGFYTQGNLQHGLPHAYAIAAAPASLQSPSTDNNSPQATNYGFEGSPTTAPFGLPSLGANGNNPNASNGGGPPSVLGNGRSSLSQTSLQHVQAQALHHQQQQQQKAKSAVSKMLPQSILGKRHRDPSSIYETVKEPYMYVNGFHRLIALLQRRFPAGKIHRIAKALSSIRPSFISCTRTLNRQDLVFMEKCFQRTLFEYEEFMSQASSPTIVLRRTGEVAAVNKEFTALTGWTKDVLLGKETNLNINTGVSPNAVAPLAPLEETSASASHGGRAGATPRMRALNAEIAKTADGKLQPLFLAELMDDDNVIDFYEDFAHLAFGDSRGSVNRKCRLLKYRTREMMDASSATVSAGGSVTDEPQTAGAPSTASKLSGPSGGTVSLGASGPGRPASSILSSRVARIDGEHGIAKIARGGKLECSYCWHIRRDTFDIPMMIVMNFLPCYYPNQEPHQLAV
ncbi:transcription factor [Ophiostoma piceae UAMH 11346]|uniref:Transcription factor n=1 Tax=Ophiostoma piceae (strain UAMH 11346) TaxID=1262450 RepID=S3CC76_OPHP1|nr:transcription factor [Ophiostoma piceae UAMH 11346]